MAVSFETFTRLANSTWIGTRDITVSDNKAKLGNFVFSSGKATNDATMAAFRHALSEKYGVFGAHAFDTVLGARAQMHKSLRACDIKAVISALPSIQGKRFVSEVNRQMDTHPKMMTLSVAMQKEVRQTIAKAPLQGIHFSSGKTTQEDLSHLAAKRIEDAIEVAKESALFTGLDTTPEDLGKHTKVDKFIQNNEATGLNNLNLVFHKGSTSVEDQVRKGIIGVGCRINRSTTNPVLFDQLKSNGVEPGFIYKNDWSLEDTRGMMADYTSDESVAALNALKDKHPTLAAQCENLPLREQIMLFGRAHPCAMAAVSDFILEKGMNNPESTIYKAFCDKYPGTPPENWNQIYDKDIKTELFVEIRDAVLNMPKSDPDFAKSPVFKHFSDRHILKLDYNESNRIVAKKAASAGKFMRPERIVTGRKMGQLYRLQTATTADKSSAGAVTEALANDLTRLAGIPSQELTIVRGQYSDGHPKLMLEAKFADGYSDMERGFLKDGQIDPSKRNQVENLGKYKAFFLVTADRDGVGSRGQNKGFANGQFFAIDPGHSLEGNGRYLEVDDNFSFKDTYGTSLKPRFNNFSVFDDDTRFAKVQGALNLRSLVQSGQIDTLFKKYREDFNSKAPNISPQEKALRERIEADIDTKEKEFKDSMAKILTVADNQFHLYDDLAADGPLVQQNAIETIENLEKLTSPTTWVSPKKQVPLTHLSVIPETRKPWRAHVDGQNIVYHCDEPLSQDVRTRLESFAQKAGATLSIDAEGCARLTVARSNAMQAFNAFSEEEVAKETHPNEAAARSRGESGLREAQMVNQRVQQPQAAPIMTQPLQLPNTLEVQVRGKTYVFNKQHYQTMIEQTPQSERPKSLEEVKSILSSRIERGIDIMQAVLTGNGHRYAATTRNVACVTLALHAATVGQNELNERGAFSVSDPDGSLYRWLDTCKELYLRTSTHAGAYHHQTVDGHMNMPRGLDIPEGMGGLMGGMRTLQYFALPEANGQPRRLYLKCETYGIYRSTISKNDEESSRSLGMQTRQRRTGDTRESIKHCMSLFTVFTRRGQSAGNRKETFPHDIKVALETEQSALRKAGFADLATRLGRNVASSNGGIRMLVENISNVIESAPNNPLLNEIADRLLEKILTYSEQRVGEASVRLGNEVMIDPENTFNIQSSNAAA